MCIWVVSVSCGRQNEYHFVIKAGATIIVLRTNASVNAQIFVFMGVTNRFDLTLPQQTIFVLHHTTSNVIMSLVIFSCLTVHGDVFKAPQLIWPDVKGRYRFDYRSSKRDSAISGDIILSYLQMRYFFWRHEKGSSSHYMCFNFKKFWYHAAYLINDFFENEMTMKLFEFFFQIWMIETVFVNS